jgi:glycosyltransferase involved in cell wall biosynthesis
MRIFFYNAYYDPHRYEGSRIHIEYLVDHLLKRGHEIWVQPASPVKNANKLPSDRISRLLQLRKIDIFYFRIVGRPLVLPYYMRWPWKSLGFNKKQVWEINAASDYVALSKGVVSQKLRQELDLALTAQAQQVDLAICNTDGLAQYAADLGIRYTKVIPLGTIPDKFNSDISVTPYVSDSPEQLNVVWMGNPRAPWHDFETIRDAAWILRDDENIKFYLLGEYPIGFSFTDNVIYKGSVNYQDIPSYLKAMDVGLAIYKNASWSRYGIFTSPLKLFDYYAAGLIVLASPIEQVKKCNVHGKTSLNIPFGDHVGLAQKLRFVANNKSIFLEMQENVRKSVENYYNWRRVARDTEEALLCL